MKLKVDKTRLLSRTSFVKLGVKYIYDTFLPRLTRKTVDEISTEFTIRANRLYNNNRQVSRYDFEKAVLGILQYVHKDIDRRRNQLWLESKGYIVTGKHGGGNTIYFRESVDSKQLMAEEVDPVFAMDLEKIVTSFLEKHNYHPYYIDLVRVALDELDTHDLLARHGVDKYQRSRDVRYVKDYISSRI